jgi:3-oxoacyl-(acyl-carrier-protein) synthase/acyl carrier protein
VVLLGRSGHFSSTLPELLHSETLITATSCNVAASEDVAAALGAGAAGGPLAAVFHAGGVLQDGVLLKQSASSVRAVFAPKLSFLQAAQAALARQPQRHVSLFASVSAFLGSPGQANYAAANAALGAWADRAQGAGLAGSSVQWGAWAEVGMAHGNAAVLARVERSGLGVVQPGGGLGALRAVLVGAAAGRLVQAIASPFSFDRLLHGLEETPYIFSEVTAAGGGDVAAAAAGFSGALGAPPLLPAAPAAAAQVDAAALAEEIGRVVAGMLGADVSGGQPLMEAGLDSLAAVELRNELGARFAVSMPATVMFDYPTVDALAGFIAGATRPAQPHAAQLAAAPAGDPRAQVTAVLGVSCRYPGGVRSAGGFWRAGAAAADLPSTVPSTRWDLDRLYAPDLAGPSAAGRMYARFGAFLEGVEAFDAALFGLPRAEALATDPQQRLLLEEAHAALGRAASTPGGFAGTDTGVYVGCMYQEYAAVLADSGSKLSTAAATGNSASFMVGRLSYTFGLAGPCISTDTACSSSLVAVHLAHRGLHDGEASAAVAAGANLMLSATTTVAICQLQALSPVGRCKTFDASADGYGRGEGFAVAVMGLQGQGGGGGAGALALLRGTAVNQDGKSSSLTAPNGPAQTKLVLAALRHGGLAAEDLGFVALHGTGTPLGDPIEMGALGQALSGGPPGRQPLTLGSVKSCYGHTEGAAGVTGLLLAVQAAAHAAAPPVMHLRSVNPYVEAVLGDWRKGGSLAAAVPRQLQAGAASVGALAGTSSFGMSGVNAHALVSAVDGGAGERRPAAAHLLRGQPLWPLPAFSPLLARAAAGVTEVLFACSLATPALSFLQQHAAGGTPTLPAAALLELLAAAAAVCTDSGHEATGGIMQAVLSTSVVAAGGAELLCRLALDSGAVSASAGGITCASAQAATVSHAARGGAIVAPRSTLVLMHPVCAAPAGHCAVVAPGVLPAHGYRCHPARLEAAAALAALSGDNDPAQALSILGCALYLPQPHRSNTELSAAAQPLSGSHALALRAAGGAAAAVEGLLTRPLVETQRARLFASAGSSAWQLVWQPADILQRPADAGPPRCLVVSTAPCPADALCEAEAPGERPALWAINATWPSEPTAAPASGVELSIGAEAHLAWLVQSCAADHCLFAERPAPGAGRPALEHAAATMLATMQAVLRSSRPLKASLVTFDAQEVPPYAAAFQPAAGVLQGAWGLLAACSCFRSFALMHWMASHLFFSCLQASPARCSWRRGPGLVPLWT